MSTTPTNQLIDGPDGTIAVTSLGSGPAVVLLPSLGRGAEDFLLLAPALAASGYHAICPEPRGIGDSDSSLSEVTLADLAADIAAVIEAVAGGHATVVGHAYGNRVARMVATRNPHLVNGVILLACGGMIPAAPEINAALHAVFDPELPDNEHLAHVRTAFFARGNDPQVWFHGWHGIVAAVQSAATQGTAVEEWWDAGGADTLVIQPAQDVLAVPENAARIVASFGARATLVIIDDAGHALLPEQPDAVAAAVITWLDQRRDRTARA